MAANMYPGPCGKCGLRVKAQEGERTKRNGAWITLCLECYGTQPDTQELTKTNENAVKAAKLSMRPDGRVMIKPEGFLGTGTFDAYRDACKEGGAAFDATSKSNVCSIEGSVRVAEALKAVGFKVNVDPELGARLQSAGARAREQVVEANVRADEIDAAMRTQGKALFPFQRIGVTWLASCPEGSGRVLADDMGLGKTVQLLAAAPSKAPVLVVCPAVAKGVWFREAMSWRRDFKLVTLVVSKSDAKAVARRYPSANVVVKEFVWPEEGELVIVNYDILTQPKGEIRKGTRLIGDEAQYLKNHKAKRTAVFCSISEAVRKNEGMTWLATAEPLDNWPPDLWGVYEAAGVAREAFRTWTDFTKLFNGHKDRWGGWHWGKPDAAKVAPACARVMLRRLKTEVLKDLPPKRVEDLPVEISLAAVDKKLLDKAEAALSKVLAEAKKQTEAEADPDVISKAINMALAAKDSGVSFEDFSRAFKAMAVAKIPAMLEQIELYEAAKEPLVVASRHTDPAMALKTRPLWGTITGDGATIADEEGKVKTVTRNEVEETFQKGLLRGVAGTIGAMGVSLTLTHAAHGLQVDEDWRPGVNRQLHDRIYRIGQTKSVLWKIMQADHPLDQLVRESVKAKQAINDASVNAASSKADHEAAVMANATAHVNAQALEALGTVTPKTPEEVTAAEAEALRKRVVEANKPKRRGPQDEHETWIAEKALGRIKNHGFVDDGGPAAFAASLLSQVGRGLTDPQWTAAKSLVAKNRSIVGRSPGDKLRPATSEVERWAADSIAKLAGWDQDRALEQNGIGFNKIDGSSGHQFANLLRTSKEGLSDAEWKEVIRIAKHYPRQVGKAPTEEEVS